MSEPITITAPSEVREIALIHPDHPGKMFRAKADDVYAVFRDAITTAGEDANSRALYSAFHTGLINQLGLDLPIGLSTLMMVADTAAEEMARLKKTGGDSSSSPGTGSTSTSTAPPN